MQKTLVTRCWAWTEHTTPHTIFPFFFPFFSLSFLLFSLRNGNRTSFDETYNFPVRAFALFWRSARAFALGPLLLFLLLLPLYDATLCRLLASPSRRSTRTSLVPSIFFLTLPCYPTVSSHTFNVIYRPASHSHLGNQFRFSNNIISKRMYVQFIMRMVWGWAERWTRSVLGGGVVNEVTCGPYRQEKWIWRKCLVIWWSVRFISKCIYVIVYLVAHIWYLDILTVCCWCSYIVEAVLPHIKNTGDWGTSKFRQRTREQGNLWFCFGSDMSGDILDPIDISVFPFIGKSNW